MTRLIYRMTNAWTSLQKRLFTINQREVINFLSMLLARSPLSTLGPLKASTMSDQLGDPFLNHASSIATKHLSVLQWFVSLMLCIKTKLAIIMQVKNPKNQFAIYIFTLLIWIINYTLHDSCNTYINSSRVHIQVNCQIVPLCTNIPSSILDSLESYVTTCS